MQHDGWWFTFFVKSNLCKSNQCNACSGCITKSPLECSVIWRWLVIYDPLKARCAVLVYIQIHINPYQHYTFMISFLYIKHYSNPVLILCKRNKIARRLWSANPSCVTWHLLIFIANIYCKYKDILTFLSFCNLNHWRPRRNQNRRWFLCSAAKVLSAAEEELKFHRSNIRRCCEGRWVVLFYMEKQPASIVKSLAGFPPIYHFKLHTGPQILFNIGVCWIINYLWVDEAPWFYKWVNTNSKCMLTGADCCGFVVLASVKKQKVGVCNGGW